MDEAQQEIGHRAPCFLPDGKHFLFFAHNSRREKHAVYVASLDSKQERKRLFYSPTAAVYAPPGYLLFTRDDTLMAQPFDVEEMELTGEPVALAKPVIWEERFGRAAFSVSQSGS